MKKLIDVQDVFNSPRIGFIVTGRNDYLDGVELNDIVEYIGKKS